MAFIIAGRLADTFTRLGFVEDVQLSGRACRNILDHCHIAKWHVDTIWKSLDGGLAMRALERRGIVMDEGATRRESLDARLIPNTGASQIAPPPIPVPLITMTAAHAHDTAIPGVAVRYYSGPLPAASFRRVSSELGFGDDVYVASPALAFLMASRGQSIVQLAAYGTSICGTYVKSQRGLWVTSYQIQPAVDLAGLRAGFRELDEMTRPRTNRTVQGLTLCRHALAHVLEHSGSPIETIVGTFFNLPVGLGGRGFAPVELNQRLDLNREQQLICGKKYLRLDVVCQVRGKGSVASEARFSQSGQQVGGGAERDSELASNNGILQRVVIEYDSRQFHEDVADVRDPYDRSRVAAAELAGVRLVPLTWEVLRDEARFDGFCDELARAIGKRLRTNDPEVLARRHRTRIELSLPTDDAHPQSTVARSLRQSA